MENRNLEPHIKLATINHLIDKNIIKKNNTIINEFNVGGYSRRVDLSIATDKYLYAFEIKSEYDSLYRLNGQIETYLKYFDKVFIVTTKKYINKVLLTTPPNVAIWEFNNGVISIIRKGKINKVNKKDIMLNMMNIDELKLLMKEEKIKSKDNKRKTLVELSLNIPIYKIKEHMLKSIKKRYTSTSKKFIEKALIQKVDIEDLKLLSTKKRDSTNENKKTNTIHSEDINNYIKALNFL
ncbi:sce7726 family protein [Photobacterium leiognathi]|uniref:sce7726 family protein n=1 Tax=Photobacterium leiognathi TaxID=553611 RepID=UPI000D15423C|nr:sce7726 family protein [Photobacterium leiognathi]PSW39344.1 hypothetical protein C0W40_21305 [Photobacterium leiognathi subsp. mandapamensis]